MIKPRNTKLGTLALIKNEKGQILGVSRKYDKNDFGLPGGTVDEGETVEQGMIREVKEETGLNVISYRPLFFSESESGNCLVVVFEVNQYDGEINITEEGDVKWVDFETIKRGTYGKFNADLEMSLTNN